MGAKQLPWTSLLLAGLLAAGCGRSPTAAPAPAPAPQTAAPPQHTEEGFHQAAYYDAPYYRLKKLEISGKTDSSALSGNGGLLIKDFKVETYQLLTNDPAHATNALEMIISAPECLLDRDAAQGSSAGPLTVQTADGRFQIDGTGYLWQQKGTNATLTISNNVSTILNKGLLATNAGNPPGFQENGGQFVFIHSHAFNFDRNANEITYSGQVHVAEEQLDILCDVMKIHRSPDSSISDLVADGNIAITDKSTGGRATGEHAVYTTAGGGQKVTLTGNPYWQSGTSEATAQAFIFDGPHRTVRAEGDAHAKLPPGSFSDPGFGFMSRNGATASAPDAGAKPMDIYSDAITLQLPATTNGPIQGVLAEGKVRIVDTQGGNQATGDRAVYTGTNGVLTLSGKASLESDTGMTARGEMLTYDRTNQTFAALTNAYLKFPATRLAQSGGFGSLPARNPDATNQFVEVTSDSYDYRGDTLGFRDHVHGNLQDGSINLGALESGILTVVSRSVLLENGRRTNILESITAEKDVHFWQPPTPDAHGKLVDGDGRCERIAIQFRTNGLLESAVASGGVRVTRNEAGANGAKPVHLTLTTDGVTATFMPETNLVQRLVADGKVVLTRNEEKASGDQVVYTDTNKTAVLTGNPRLEQTGGWMTSDDAIIYNLANKVIRATGNPRTWYRFSQTSNGLSQSNLSVPPEKKTR